MPIDYLEKRYHCCMSILANTLGRPFDPFAIARN
jgi:hypothetical protein